MHYKWRLYQLVSGLLTLAQAVVAFFGSPFLLLALPGVAVIVLIEKIKAYKEEAWDTPLYDLKWKLQTTPEQAANSIGCYRHRNREEACRSFQMLYKEMADPSHPWHNWGPKERARLWHTFWKNVELDLSMGSIHYD